jgi:hypothetical protein
LAATALGVYHFTAGELPGYRVLDLLGERRLELPVSVSYWWDILAAAGWAAVIAFMAHWRSSRMDFRESYLRPETAFLLIMAGVAGLMSGAACVYLDIGLIVALCGMMLIGLSIAVWRYLSPDYDLFREQYADRVSDLQAFSVVSCLGFGLFYGLTPALFLLIPVFLLLFTLFLTKTAVFHVIPLMIRMLISLVVRLVRVKGRGGLY